MQGLVCVMCILQVVLFVTLDVLRISSNEYANIRKFKRSLELSIIKIMQHPGAPNENNK